MLILGETAHINIAPAGPCLAVCGDACSDAVIGPAASGSLVPGGGPHQPNYSRRVLAAQPSPAPHSTQHMMPST